MAIRVTADNTLDTQRPASAVARLSRGSHRAARGDQESAAAALETVATASCLQRMNLQAINDELYTLMALTSHQPRREKRAAAIILDLAADVSRVHRQVLRARTKLSSLSSGALTPPAGTEQQLLRQAVHADLRAVLTALDKYKASRRCVRPPARHLARPQSQLPTARTGDSTGTPKAPLAETACCDELRDALRTTRWVLARLSRRAGRNASRTMSPLLARSG